ncbi:hypothetical protein GCM10025867_50230 (plasmid) [Frondihabitans sucicola]|uniref:Uncharacterized protein n=1 Tax=Frondihabitans sucicola TaxID=1268041 RepID=A0ABN6Y621_9MICO|nr:hypothetical protein [Frondihabitans sucicola]BDZ52782.1 hypothetical protein GCM10025867_50230 [Frondihabitans sucicola]
MAGWLFYATHLVVWLLAIIQPYAYESGSSIWGPVPPLVGASLLWLCAAVTAWVLSVIVERMAGRPRRIGKYLQLVGLLVLAVLGVCVFFVVLAALSNTETGGVLLWPATLMHALDGYSQLHRA